MMSHMDITTNRKEDTMDRIEAQIDTQLAELWSEANALHSRKDGVLLSLGYKFGTVYYQTKSRRAIREPISEILELARQAVKNDTLRTFELRSVVESLADLDEIDAAIEANKAEAAPLQKKFNDAPWSRFFLVPDGHIHSSMNCSSCRITTAFSWLPTLSGLTEKDAVEAHGPNLCTFCFPSAPVEWTVGEKKEEDDKCPGSGTYDHTNFHQTSYTGSGQAECNHCHQRVGVTTSHKIRKHKA